MTNAPAGIRFATDENFNGVLLRGLLLKKPDLDIVRIQDSPVSGADDPTVLEWAAENGRILLTHDVRTITRYANERIAAGSAMPGVIELDPTASFGIVIEHLIMAIEATSPADWANVIDYFPIK